MRVFVNLVTAASVSVPMEARQYMRQLVEQCMMQFFVAVKARESAQLFLKVPVVKPPHVINTYNMFRYTTTSHRCLLLKLNVMSLQ